MADHGQKPIHELWFTYWISQIRYVNLNPGMVNIPNIINVFSKDLLRHALSWRSCTLIVLFHNIFQPHVVIWVGEQLRYGFELPRFWGSVSETNTCKIKDFEILYLTGALKWAPCKICEWETVYLKGAGIRQGQELQWGCVRYQILKSYILQGR